MTFLFEWFAAGLVSVLGQIFLKVAARIVIVAAFITMFVAAIWAYLEAGQVIIGAVGATMPEIVSGVYQWFCPVGINKCILSIFAMKMLRFFTDLYLEILQTKVRAATRL